MSPLEKLRRIFSEPDSQKLDTEISAAGDLLAGYELRDSEVIKIVNFLLGRIEYCQDDTIAENILNVCLQIMTAHQVFAGFDLDVILPCLNTLNTECSSYILTFLGFSGDQRYKGHIEPFLSVDALKEEAAEALRELDYRKDNKTGVVQL